MESSSWTRAPRATLPRSHHFFFGNAVLTDKLHLVDNAGRKDEIHLHPATFTKQVSKKGPRKGKTYTMVTFA